MMKKIDFFMNKLASGSSYVGAVGILIVMCVICYDVAGRTFFNHPMIGTPEIVQNSLAAIVFLMLPWATHLGQNVRSTMLKNRMPERAAYGAEALAYIVGTALFIGILISVWNPMLFATKIRDFQGEGLRVPIYPTWWAIFYGSALCCWQCLSKMIKALAAMFGKNVAIEDDGGGIQI
jgi:TRAP-type C4-dicarboxylate transport system permease small subunit